MLERREAKRQRLQAKLTETAGTGSPAPFAVLKPVDDPESQGDEWLTPEVLEDVQALLAAAGDDPEVLKHVRLTIPAYVLRHLGSESA